METDKKLFTVTVYSENQVGLLNQISIIFTRRCLNIESISGSSSSVPGIHKFTVTCYSTRPMMEKVIKQIEKRIDVLRAFLYTDDDIVYQEIALYKVPTSRLIDGSNIEKIIRRHDARILEITREYTVIEKTGHRNETEALFMELKPYDLRQFMRSGRVVVTRDATELVPIFLNEQERRRDLQQNPKQ